MKASFVLIFVAALLVISPKTEVMAQSLAEQRITTRSLLLEVRVAKIDKRIERLNSLIDTCRKSIRTLQVKRAKHLRMKNEGLPEALAAIRNETTLTTGPVVVVIPTTMTLNAVLTSPSLIQEPTLEE